MRLLVLLGVLLALGAAFALVESRWPGVPGQRRWRRGIVTDLLYYFASPLRQVVVQVTVIAAVAVAAALVLGLEPRDLRDYSDRDTFVSRQPLALQALELIVLADFLGYWSHRAFHAFERLWRFHAIHHSSVDLDWLSAVRLHPLNEALQNAVIVTPLFLLGFTPGAVAAYLPILTLYAIALHANVAWDFGPLRYVIASPTFHRWHHSDQPEALNRNFAGLLPLWDLFFGTLYLPRGRQPQHFGVLGGGVPGGVLGQLLYPFGRGSRGRKPASASPRSRSTRSERLLTAACLCGQAARHGRPQQRRQR